MKSHLNPNERIQAGLPPGQGDYLGRQTGAEVRMKKFRYNFSFFEETDIKDLSELGGRNQDQDTTEWIIVEGLHDTHLIAEVCKKFGIHMLVKEDILNTHHRPKIESFAEYDLIVLKTISLDQDTSEIMLEQVSLVVGKGFVISFQETNESHFEQIRDRIRNLKGKVREMKSNYLAYIIFDVAVDKCHTIVEEVSLRIDAMERKLIEDTDKSVLQRVYEMKRELNFLRQVVWPMRETVLDMDRQDDNQFAENSLDIYLRDLYDHITRIVDTIDSCRETTSGMIDLYLSSSSIRMNEELKFLTVISAIFIPITFITGIYGMNFEKMPGIQSNWSFFAVFGIMAILVIVQLYWFRRKKWI